MTIEIVEFPIEDGGFPQLCFCKSPEGTPQIIINDYILLVVDDVDDDEHDYELMMNRLWMVDEKDYWLMITVVDENDY